MYQKLEIFGMAQGLAQHAAARQSIIAQNVANADTPQYKAQVLDSFAKSYSPGGDGKAMRTTRSAHLVSDSGNAGHFNVQVARGPSSPNGNSVSLEGEMIKASQARHQHDMALSIYSTSMNILRTSLGRGR